ncbi:GT-D fold domain-containing glycosyltransferase [Lacticaseibacillus paracasei]|jgi:glycosyltransferase family protein|uniref:GT-D fold domain-containing glycosyltransferase n=1 Tax=Lacticaseibacillus paracasei TaxID=1597 RepID=UPI000343EB91|nr:GT-D fold domain-containing glycosyltransferase [Lacticaseibacillus paracasei]EPC40346.1 hypothetical protein Lpp229_12574 [Lacticaseibacillus paracasei subsp. paracasei Lpp229]MCT3319280.1 DUF1792 domain-containing protein [Lacticaseibacillus paracasei]RNE41076.1 glycosyltransferase, family [Lacticaseibacillus paracasei]
MDIKRVLTKNPLSQFAIRAIRYCYFPLYKVVTKNFQFKIVGPEDTIAEIIRTRKSIARFGDGEFNLMLDAKGIGFQEYTPAIADALKQSFKGGKGVLVALPHGFTSTRLDRPYIKSFWWSYVVRNKSKIDSITATTETSTYYDASFTRTATELKNRKRASQTISSVKSIWSDRDVLMVEGKSTRFGVGNDLFSQARSVKRIIAPEESAFEKISEITTSIINVLDEMKQVEKSPVILLSLGPTASVLAVELSNRAQCIDIGHFDLQYESFVRGTNKVVQVEGKYNNESVMGNHVSEISDTTYSKQIIERI